MSVLNVQERLINQKAGTLVVYNNQVTRILSVDRDTCTVTYHVMDIITGEPTEWEVAGCGETLCHVLVVPPTLFADTVDDLLAAVWADTDPQKMRRRMIGVLRRLVRIEHGI